MKLTKNKLKQIIREELENAMSETGRPKTTEASREANRAVTDQYDEVRRAEKALNAAKEEEEKATREASHNALSMSGGGYDDYSDMFMYKSRARLAAAEAVYKVAVATYKKMQKK